MDTIQNILVPTDFSADADEAFRLAYTLASLTGARIILCHVAGPPAVVTEGGRLLTGPGKGEAVNLWERFQTIQPNAPAVRVEHQVIVADRPRAGAILEMLDKLGCDLIVMGTHGHSRLSHLLFGSVTQEVVRLARCPVMVVKAPTAAHGPAPSTQASVA